MKPKNKEIQAAIMAKDAARDFLNLAICNAVRYCKHREIGECEYRPSSFGSSYPPERACLNCGLREVGWGCGYYILDVGLIIAMPRDKLQSLSTITIQEYDKTMALRAKGGAYRFVREKLGLKPIAAKRQRRLASV